jgi:hypothetical protein
MKRTILTLVAALALAPVALAGDNPPGKDAPATETTAGPESTDTSEIDSGFSIPAADGETKDKPKEKK